MYYWLQSINKMTNKSLAFNEDPLVQQVDFVSQALLVPLLVPESETKNLPLQACLRWSSVSRVHQTPILNQKMNWCETSFEKLNLLQGVNAAQFYYSLQQLFWKEEKGLRRCNAREQGAVYLLVLLLHDSPLELIGSRFPLIMIMCGCIEKPRLIAKWGWPSGMEGNLIFNFFYLRVSRPFPFPWWPAWPLPAPPASQRMLSLPYCLWKKQKSFLLP